MYGALTRQRVEMTDQLLAEQGLTSPHLQQANEAVIRTADQLVQAGMAHAQSELTGRLLDILA
jgi:hypothetical protein